MRELVNDDNIQPYPKNHTINTIWSICNNLLKKVFTHDSFIHHLNEIGRLVGEFAKIDPNSQAFRYPEDRNGNASLAGITNINLSNIKEVIAKMSVVIEGADTEIGEFLSHRADI